MIKIMNTIIQKEYSWKKRIDYTITPYLYSYRRIDISCINYLRHNGSVAMILGTLVSIYKIIINLIYVIDFQYN